MLALISAQKLSKVYGEKPSETVALNNVSLEIKKGEFVAIVGASGSGKSTLMHILGCLDRPTSGKYLFADKAVSKLSENELAEIRNKKIGFVFQFFNLLPRTSAIKNVALPLMYSGLAGKEREKQASKYLVKVGLAGKLNSLPSQLSGGEQQRVAIARALVNNPSIIFADEPTGNIDSKASVEIMKIFQNLNKNGHTIVVITHDKEVARYASRIITLYDGQISSNQKRRK